MNPSKKCVEVRRLRAADARGYRAVLIEALIVHPDCFSDDYNCEVSRPLLDIEQELERGGIFGAWFGGALVGIGSGTVSSASKRRHCGMIRNLYVREQYRHRGFARFLLKEILSYASVNLDQVEAEIPSGCENAVHLFEQFGFRFCGLLPSGLKVDGEELDVWTMSRIFR